jgi:hypothetical protein
MAQDILTIDREKFRAEVTRISFSQLKSILEGLFTFIKEHALTLPMDTLIDLERKQTIIWAELQRRGHLRQKDVELFHKWLFSKHNKKVF